jgi:hypothetical protein
MRVVWVVIVCLQFARQIEAAHAYCQPGPGEISVLTVIKELAHQLSNCEWVALADKNDSQ